MTTEHFPQPGDIELESISIANFENAEVWELKPFVTEFNLYESIDLPFMYGDLVFSDALSLLTRLPIIGEESLFFKFRTLSTSTDHEYEWVELPMKVTKLDSFEIETQHMETMRLHFVSPQRFADIGSKINKGFGPGITSQFVSTIAKDNLGLDGSEHKEIEVHATAGQQVFAIPNLSPVETIRFLASESESLEYKTSNFVFFQDHKQWNFATLDYLIEKPVKERYYTFWQALPRSSGNQSQGNETTRNTQQETSPGLEGTGLRNPLEWRTMKAINFKSLFDVEVNMEGGMYHNSVWHIDPVRQEFMPTEVKGRPFFNYWDEFDDFEHTTTKNAFNFKSSPLGSFLSANDGANKLVSDNGDQPTTKGSGLAHVRYMMSNKNQLNPDFMVFPRKRQDFLNWLVSSQGQLSSIVCELTVPGDSDRRAGDNIYFELHEIGATDDVINRFNKYIRGKYFITGIRHKYNPVDGYTTTFECVKNCFENKIETDKVSGQTYSPQQIPNPNINIDDRAGPETRDA